MPKPLQGKLAIITGAAKSNGVGFATARALAEQGADIVLHYNTNAAAAQQSAATLRGLGVEVTTVQADAASATFGSDIVAAALAAFPGRTIDVLVNNAGHMAGFPSLADFPLEAFDAAFHINARSAFLLVQAAAPHLTSPGARVVSVSSIVARMGFSSAGFYAGSKAALHALTRGWAEELGARGVTANVVLLGPVDTDIVLPDEHPLTQRFRADQSLKRNGTAAEAAQAIVFLAGPGSSFITGQVLNVDGGIAYA